MPWKFPGSRTPGITGFALGHTTQVSRGSSKKWTKTISRWFSFSRQNLKKNRCRTQALRLPLHQAPGRAPCSCQAPPHLHSLLSLCTGRRAWGLPHSDRPCPPGRPSGSGEALSALRVALPSPWPPCCAGTQPWEARDCAEPHTQGPNGSRAGTHWDTGSSLRTQEGGHGPWTAGHLQLARPSSSSGQGLSGDP